ncbi:uncharacterized protein BCR38DRAFT_443047 [Pseudomassariella vexata]|uniref:LysM domain-containing protein n=1 Tax=Pseudomassariella vexata TaxID=1141098 RepID=A0A1Y2DQQ3_9PEZI|nr:uncharacterized protein BCR38DRAFT_443047 [Pseudomassariella vexata]ORY60965.1 hypothetical protein BCR38DRAFT_443047 [Pseudomassariella vexata]
MTDTPTPVYKFARAAGDNTTATTTYTVESGDTLLKIATTKGFNSGVCQIAALNAIPDPSFISVGQVLQIPLNVAEPDNTSCVKNKTSSFIPDPTETVAPDTVAPDGTVEHTVVKGETLAIISKQFNSGICDIAKLNNLTNPDQIEVGQVLKVPINVANPDDSSCLP